jgi:hypothetical protein
MRGIYIDLVLGGQYTIKVVLNNYILTTTGLKLIQVTPKGYNFLDVDKNKCIFDKHFYRSNKNKKFFISKKLIIKQEI